MLRKLGGQNRTKISDERSGDENISPNKLLPETIG